MSIIGLDFGSHTASIAIWYEEKNDIEVIADDLGSRTIPCTVAFRGDEILTGQSAISQQHKNSNNTFDDVRAILLNANVQTVNVPLLDKQLNAQELVSHFFRNIHNQIKQQVGKVVRECIISTPTELNETTKQRFVESAQAGGIRIKSFISDSAATLLAYGLDDVNKLPSKTLVVDIGWSRTDISLFDVSSGLFVPAASASTTAACGKLFVDLMADHCAKDFQRKAKFPCSDNSKSMMRLRRECENAMKSLSTGAEATIDIDSLCEGVDYSTKLSRARFEDLLTIPIIQLKNTINEVLSSAKVEPTAVNQICMSGGPSAMPKIVATVKALFTSANFPKGKFESSETQCIGAAIHGRNLVQLGLVDKAPTASPECKCLDKSIQLSSNGSNSVTVIPSGSILPINVNFDAVVAGTSGYLKLSVGGHAADPITAVGEVVFTVNKVEGEEHTPVAVSVAVSTIGEIKVEVVQNSEIIGNVVIPAV